MSIKAGPDRTDSRQRQRGGSFTAAAPSARADKPCLDDIAARSGASQ